MLHTVYILYSADIDKFYIGRTSDDIHQRIRRHLSDHHGYTSRAKDWKLAYIESFDNKTDAVKRESEIKSWKSRQRLAQLIGAKNRESRP